MHPIFLGEGPRTPLSFVSVNPPVSGAKDKVHFYLKIGYTRNFFGGMSKELEGGGWAPLKTSLAKMAAFQLVHLFVV